MTAHRRPEIRFSEAPRGTCRWCGAFIVYEDGDKAGEVNKRRRWHPDCVDTYNESDPREARRRIRKRDRGHCAQCQIDTYKVRRELMKLKRGRAKTIREQGYKPGKSFWELDHIVPLIDGGGHEDENLQTLCTPCHNKKTGEEARERRIQDPDDDAPLIDAHTEGPASFDIPLPVASSETEKAKPEPSSEQTSKPEPEQKSKAKSKSKSKNLDELLDAADVVNARVRKVLSDDASETIPTPETSTA